MTLRSLVERLPPGTGTEVLTAADLDLPVGPPVILDDPQAVDDRRIVLAVGVAGDARQTRLLRDLAPARPGAIVLRHPVSPAVVARASTCTPTRSAIG
ncbi:hypothetical protein [Nonomuraea sediminis]|uniref:hypothetical protein n=1 Tax=Nonomuraea sediminis TaxID=2835864 RepID=UPI001BDC5ABF|nr:hypothetical protein [Nonomuraea sediminis]